jgi:hypothetical protein
MRLEPAVTEAEAAAVATATAKIPIQAATEKGRFVQRLRE